MANSGIKGLDSFLAFLDDSPKKMQAAARVGLHAGAQLIEAQAKANCPVGAPSAENVRLYGDYPGALRDSIHATVVEQNGKIYASVKAGGRSPSGADVFYAHIIEFTGAAAHVIKSRDGKALAIAGGQFASVRHPGMKAHPFLRPALDARELEAVALVDAGIKTVLEK